MRCGTSPILITPRQNPVGAILFTYLYIILKGYFEVYKLHSDLRKILK